MAKCPTAAMGKQLVLVMIIGGTSGGPGWGVTASGKIVKIPPRGPLTASIKKIRSAMAKGM